MNLNLRDVRSGLTPSDYIENMAMFGVAGFFAIYLGVSTINRMKPKAPIKFGSKEEEDYVKRYIAHVHHESHKPVLVREPYAGPSGLN
ncbi:hypothetical protein HDU76_011947 [Blyttiomyces sp. JEL0837]|nr:hypothetical protein HDU76_011947 [Blyttiomyces sp. JEL0837]